MHKLGTLTPVVYFVAHRVPTHAEGYVMLAPYTGCPTPPGYSREYADTLDAVDRLQKRLGDRRLDLAVTPDARTWLAERGYDPIYGARPLRRLMQHEIDDRLARALLAGEIRDGDTVRVDLAGDELTVLSTGPAGPTG